ncbi:MAG TPA: NADP-dependent phosphogluconate dehydrogenase [Thermoanaerobaculia bacterium]|nr:NADP-dependent phosphogluconate dehydrogenase [Thermoanaerobaculia bacterium]
MPAAFGIIGLGVMGQNLALNVEGQGYPIAVWNLERDWTDRFVAAHAGRRITPARTFEELVAALERPRRILMMIKAGAPVDQTLDALRPLLERGDVVIDGGNSHFRDTERRQESLSGTGIHFVGCGVSGGEQGARHGASLMPGGEREAWDPIRPMLEAAAAKNDLGACVTWVGPGGSGHFVKMVHNGIEYGDMQIIAEVYDVLRRTAPLSAAELAAVFDEWNEGPLESFLVEVTAKIFRVPDDQTGRPLVELILDAAGQKGTGRWSVQLALEAGVPVPTIAAAVDARVTSSLRNERLVAAGILPGPAPGRGKDAASRVVADAREAFLGSRICAYAQGFALIAAASHERGWGVDLREIARIWTGGCIIRAKLLREVIRAYGSEPRPFGFMLDPDVVEMLRSAQEGWRRTLRRASESGIPLPAIGASLAWYDACRSPSLPQNLTQAQRDFFGAHGYERIDRPGLGPFHTDWESE